MRKMKKINGYLVVRFNDRERRANDTLGGYGVIDAELYTGRLDIDRGAMEYDDADTLDAAIEQARGLNAEKDYTDEKPFFAVIRESSGGTEELAVDAAALFEKKKASLALRVESDRDADPRTAAHELAGFADADGGFLVGADAFRPKRDDSFLHAGQGAPMQKPFSLGLALLEDCPPNDCMVYRNVFEMCLELDGQIDRVTGLARRTLEAELFRRQHELFQMYRSNYAVGEYRKKRGLVGAASITVTPHRAGDGGILAMPLRSHIPRPTHGDWRLTVCPVCGAECWESPLARRALENRSSGRRAPPAR